jgi:hypothetical protein
LTLSGGRSESVYFNSRDCAGRSSGNVANIYTFVLHDHFHFLSAQNGDFLPREIDNAILTDVKGFFVNFTEDIPAISVRILFGRALVVVSTLHYYPARQFGKR